VSHPAVTQLDGLYFLSLPSLLSLVRALQPRSGVRCPFLNATLPYWGVFGVRRNAAPNTGPHRTENWISHAESGGVRLAAGPVRFDVREFSRITYKYGMAISVSIATVRVLSCCPLSFFHWTSYRAYTAACWLLKESPIGMHCIVNVVWSIRQQFLVLDFVMRI